MVWSREAASGEVRMERDSLGELAVPKDAYWGVHTARALRNFPISQRPISVYPALPVALAQVKQAAAQANAELGDLPEDKAKWISQACQEIIDGKLHDQFVVGVIQGGAGTSTNMNANEVITNRALELAGHQKGEYQHIHPLDDTNRSQSTNDVYPTALKLALRTSLKELLEQIDLLRTSFLNKGEEFADVLKMGRTQMQDAVPMTLGQEFRGFAMSMTEEIQRIEGAMSLLTETNLGGTAIGTGINAEPSYVEAVHRHLNTITGTEFKPSPDMIEATSDTGSFVTLSASMKRAAIKLSKICNDLRLLSSGPQSGLGEINLPAVQAGSSIMPGKVNPVVPEAVNQVAFVIVGVDVTVTMASEAGQLQLNAFEPVIAHSLLQSIRWLGQSCYTLRVNCVDGITANVERLRNEVASNVGLVTALTPVIGYAAAAKIAKQALATGKRIDDLVMEAGLMSREQLEGCLNPARLTSPHLIAHHLTAHKPPA